MQMTTRTQIINYLIAQNNYKRYLEIGVEFPENNFVKIEVSHKDAVDPHPRGYFAGRCNHKMTSDAFFKKLDDEKSDLKWDICFIDGMHSEEQVIVDILNCSKYLNPGGILVIHDCDPPTEWHTRPYEQYKLDGSYWNGTTYAGFVRFKQANPQLDICTVRTDWGCGVIRNPENLPIKSDFSTQITWKEFDNNRKELLNPITPDEFLSKYARK